MAEEIFIETMSNTTPQSCVEGVCNCDTMWSLAQQFCYLRLCDPVAGQRFHHTLMEDYEKRAKRIAATYARFYLEWEPSAGSDPGKKGRFYWMALGAFASKTVACTLEYRRVKIFPTTVNGLGKGNFWLFNDIAGWHYYYARFGSSFETCRDQRDTSRLTPAVKKQVDKLPWSAESLGKVNNLKVTAYIQKGFAYVKAFEQETKANKRPDLQLDHLLAIADHEQRMILQPLIYDDPAFADNIKLQRWPVANEFSPEISLVFTSECLTDDPKLKSLPPEGTKLEQVESRMKWIGQAAKKFHFRMQNFNNQMEEELRSMAGWFARQD